MLKLLILLISTDAQIDQYIKDMGHKKWKERECATWKLICLGERVFPKIKKACSDADPEIATRAELVKKTFYENILPTNYCKLPWIDGLPEDYPDRAIIVDKYLEGKNRDWDKNLEYVGYRLATLEFITDLFNNGKSRKDIISLLDKMVEGEKKQLQQLNSNPYQKGCCSD
jgi:hypothetical protein